MAFLLAPGDRSYDSVSAEMSPRGELGRFLSSYEKAPAEEMFFFPFFPFGSDSSYSYFLVYARLVGDLERSSSEAELSGLFGDSGESGCSEPLVPFKFFLPPKIPLLKKPPFYKINREPKKIMQM